MTTFCGVGRVLAALGVETFCAPRLNFEGNQL